MSVEDLIKEEREHIEELKIDESSKKKMLKAFDDTVYLYQDNKELERIVMAISNTARFIGSVSATESAAKTLALYHDKRGSGDIAGAISYKCREYNLTVKKIAEILRLNEIIQTIDLYQNKEEVNKIAEVIGHIADNTNSEEAVIETAKTLQLYHNKKGAGEVAKAIGSTAHYTKSEEETKKVAKILRLEEIMKTVDLCKNEIITKTIAKTASYTMSKEATIETAKTLALYHNKKGIGGIARAIVKTAEDTKSEEAVIETAKILRNVKDIYNLDLKLFYSYITHISDNISKKIKYSLSFKDINKITDTYSLTMGFCKEEKEEFREKVKEGFFHHLNKAIDTGNSIENKIKIMNKWSDNVYTTFKDHPEDFMEFQKHL